jgi:hypothetical protein
MSKATTANAAQMDIVGGVASSRSDFMKTGSSNRAYSQPENPYLSRRSSAYLRRFNILARSFAVRNRIEIQMSNANETSAVLLEVEGF